MVCRENDKHLCSCQRACPAHDLGIAGSVYAPRRHTIHYVQITGHYSTDNTLLRQDNYLFKSSSIYQRAFIFWEYDMHVQLVLVLHILLHKLYIIYLER